MTHSTPVGEPEVQVSREVYDNLDDMPLDVRAQFEEMRAQGLTESRREVTHQQITLTDEQGNTQAYTSTDDLPPHIRARIEEALGLD